MKYKNLILTILLLVIVFIGAFTFSKFNDQEEKNADFSSPIEAGKDASKTENDSMTDEDWENIKKSGGENPNDSTVVDGEPQF